VTTDEFESLAQVVADQGQCDELVGCVDQPQNTTVTLTLISGFIGFGEVGPVDLAVRGDEMCLPSSAGSC
jgi:hypothetical protein